MKLVALAAVVVRCVPGPEGRAASARARLG